MITQFLLDVFRDLLMMLLFFPLTAYKESILGVFPSIIYAIQYVNSFLGTVLPGDGWFLVMQLIGYTFLLAIFAPVVRFFIKVIRGT